MVYRSNKPSILDTMLEYGDRARQRDMANTLQQIQLNQELEQAKKNKDYKAEFIATQKKAILEKQAQTSSTLDGIFYGFALLLVSGFLFLVAHFLIPVIFK